MELPAGQQQPIGTASAASAEQVLKLIILMVDTLRRSLISKSGNNSSLIAPHHWVHVQFYLFVCTSKIPC